MKKLIFTLIIFSVFAGKSFSQSYWVWQNPLPQGNTINDIKFVNPNTGYAVGDGGTIIKTTNGGADWFFCSSEKYGKRNKISLAGNNIVYISDYNSIWKSTNEGLNWTIIPLTFYPDPVFFIDASTGFAGCSIGKILKTTDGGSNWNSYSIAQLVNNILSIFFCDVNTGFLGVGGKIFKSTNSGVNWAVVYQDSLNNSRDYRSIVFVNQTTGYTVGNFGRVIKTTDSGNSWFQIASNYDYDLKSICAVNESRLISCGTKGKIIESTNQGITWTQTHSDPGFTFYSVHFAGESSVYAAGSKGITVKSTDAGDSWIKLSSGIYQNITKCYFADENTGFAACGNDTILKTTNSGLTWNILLTVYPDTKFSSLFFIDQNTGFAGGNHSMVIKTTDGGSTWNNLTPVAQSTVFTIYFVNPSTGYVGGDLLFNVCKTTNGGVDWVTQDIPTQGDIRQIKFFNSNTGFVGTGIAGILKTTNAGENWIFNHQCPGGIIDDIDYPEENTVYVANSGGISKTTDCGNTWSIIANGDGIGVSFADANTGFIVQGFPSATTSYAKISRTTNGGLNWITEYPGLADFNFSDIFTVNSDISFIVGDYGATLIYDATMVNVNNNNSIPKSFTLSQNYPNPFNPLTRIKFAIPLLRGVSEGRGVLVRLIIYDILGREITTLVNEELKPGTYEVEWDASNYPSGVYFYKLITKDYSETRKMVLVK